MATMAVPEPALSRVVVQQRGGTRRLVWALWIVVSVIGALIGAVAATQVRALATAPDTVGYGLGYIATVVDAFIIAGAQWLLLRRYRSEVDWWVPATVTASLLSAIVLIPTVLNLFAPPRGTGVLISSAAALAAAGLMTGTAQALVLGRSRRAAWVWIPATALGGGAAGALTSTLAPQLLGLQLPAYMLLGVVAAIGASLIAGSQALVVRRVLR
jgi:hypothetical protein